MAPNECWGISSVVPLTFEVCYAVAGGGGHEADVSGSVLDSGQESRTGDHSTRPHVAPSVWPQLVSSTECSKPRRPVRHRSQPAWMRTGEWHIS